MKATPQKIAKRYAIALFDLAVEKKQVDDVYKDMATAMESSDHLLKHKIEPLTFQFLQFLAQKGRMGLLKEIAREFESLYFDHKDILKVKITSARPLDKEQLTSIAARLKTRFNKDIRHDVDTNPRLIGGFKVQVGDTIYDYSVKTQLENFKNKIFSS